MRDETHSNNDPRPNLFSMQRYKRVNSESPARSVYATDDGDYELTRAVNGSDMEAPAESGNKSNTKIADISKIGYLLPQHLRHF